MPMNRSAELRALAKTLLMVLAFVLLAVAQASAQATTVIVVRHAERADGGMNASRDPLLSDAGKARAESLRDALAHASVSAIYTTEFQRTRLTGMPLAEKLGIQPTTVNASVPIPQLAAKIRAEQTGRTVLVVGHSNTIGPIVEALGGPPIGDVPDSEYGNMFIVMIDSAGSRLIRSRY